MFRHSATALAICSATVFLSLVPTSASAGTQDALTGGQATSYRYGTVAARGEALCQFSWKEPWAPSRIQFRTDLGEVVNAKINGKSYTATFRRVPIPPNKGPGNVPGVYASAYIDCGGGYKPAALKRPWIAPARESGIRRWDMTVAGWGR
jgi:hypothetical protein